MGSLVRRGKRLKILLVLIFSYVPLSFFAYRPWESVYADYVSIKIILLLEHWIQNISEFGSWWKCTINNHHNPIWFRQNKTACWNATFFKNNITYAQEPANHLKPSCNFSYPLLWHSEIFNFTTRITSVCLNTKSDNSPKHDLPIGFVTETGCFLRGSTCSLIFNLDTGPISKG